MPKTRLNDWEIFYEDRGSGPPVILIHGFLMDHAMFDPQVAALSDRYRIVTPDLRIHGESERRKEMHTQWDMMADHIALCDLLRIERAVFGGVSQGGFQSLRAALKFPERVEGLILIDTQAGPEDEVRAPMYEAFANVVASEGWNDEILDVATVSMFGESAPNELKEHWKKRWTSHPTSSEVEAMFAVSRRDDITDRLSEITAPAIVIHGEEDVSIDISLAEVLADGLPNLVEFVRVPKAGHSSTVESPEVVTAAIERFLRKIYS